MKGQKPSLVNVVPMKGAAHRPTPDAPDHLQDEDREVWNRLAPVLIGKGRLEPEFEDSFANYCIMAGQVVRSSHDIAILGTYREVKTRNGLQDKQRAAWLQLDKAMERMNQYAARFGLTPVDAARLSSGGQGDLFDDLMRHIDGGN
ncbi:P27 family phage terminase small subunit [Salipiger marinus]|uniref:P27 family phage terminase small subunit n=1 Tax=Salipiger marinus TaxID=555512 RepID=UPI002CD8A134|nr:P27 family phage terminase small subunit [Salipiger manganoxidans]MEB3421740.1 P27 family phage terminase small subunit [Salipiger manganoxidans]